MNWFSRRPEDLVEQSTPREALDALWTLSPNCSLEHWDRLLDHVLRHWVVTVISRENDLAGTTEMHLLCNEASMRLAKDAPMSPYLARWKAFSDLLESKRLRTRASKDEDRIKKIPTELLHLLKEGDLDLGGVCSRLGVQSKLAHQIVGALEQAGAIKICDSRVHLTEKGERLTRNSLSLAD